MRNNVSPKLILFSFIVSLCISTGVAAIDTAPRVIDSAAYTKQQRMVAVEPGRKLNLYCIGKGSPTVVFDAGLGDSTSVWGYVQPIIAEKTKTCSYDRAGIGFSDPGRRVANSSNIVDDLHKLLVAARIKPPYVMVGHSYGGLNIRLYANKYASDVVGMVLVDPTSEDTREAYRKLDPKHPTFEQWNLEADAAMIGDQRQCVASAIAGFVPGTDIYTKCDLEPSPQLSDAVNAAALRQKLQPAYQQAVLSERESIYSVSAGQVRLARSSYGDMPLNVLTSGPSLAPVTVLTPEEQAHQRATAQMKVTLRDNMARLSSVGKNQVVVGSGHYIQFDKPQFVIDAINDVLERTSKKR